MKLFESKLARRLDAALAEAAAADARDPIVVAFDLPMCVSIVATLQLALRHPGNGPISARGARLFCEYVIAQLREMGLTANAAALELGFDPEMDDEIN